MAIVLVDVARDAVVCVHKVSQTLPFHFEDVGFLFCNDGRFPWHTINGAHLSEEDTAFYGYGIVFGGIVHLVE